MKNYLKKGFISVLSLVIFLSVFAVMGTVYAGNIDSMIIHYHKNDQTEEIIDKVYMDDTEKLEDVSLFSLENERCIGWNTKPDGTGTFFDSETLVKEIMGEKSEIDVYAIWEKETYTLIFNDIVDGKEYEYTRIENDGSEVEMPEMYQRNMDEIFIGWECKNNQQVYDIKDKITVSEDTVFNAVWDRNVAEISEEETGNISQIIYRRMCFNGDREEKKVTDNLTLALSYPDDFYEDGSVTRKFLYWSTSPMRYINDDFPAIYSDDDLTSYYEYGHSETLILYAIYENKGLFINYLAPENISDFTQYTYELDLDDSSVMLKLKDITIQDFSKLEYEDYVYDQWKTDWGSYIEPGYYSSLNIGVFDVFDCTNIFINGYVTLRAEISDPGFQVYYIANDILDSNRYGTKKGKKYVIEIADGKSLEYGNYKFIGWSLYENTDKAEFYAGQKVSITVLKEFVRNQGIIVLYPVLKETAVIKYDVSDIPIEIEKLDDQFMELYEYNRLLDLTGEFEKLNYVFIGWKDQEGHKYYKGDHVYIQSNMELTPIYEKNVPIKVIYDSSSYPGFICPTDTAEYMIGDDIPIKSVKNSYYAPDKVFNRWSFDGVNIFNSQDGIIHMESYLRWIDFETSTITLIPVFNELRYDEIVLNLNSEDASYTDHVLISYDIPTQPYSVCPQREGYYFIGWSTTPDNKGVNNKFYSYGTVYNEEITPDADGIRRLYAQWITPEEASRDDSFCKLNLIRYLGHDQKQELTIYRKKGTILSLNELKKSWECKNSSLKELLVDYSKWNLVLVDINGNILFDVPNESIVDCEIITGLPENFVIEFYDNKHGQLKNSLNEIVNYMTVNAENGNYYRILDEIPTPIPDEGYRFKGWQLLPYYDIKLNLPSRAVSSSLNYKKIYLQ